MTAPLRRAGAGTLADGSELVWSVDGGRRGRRWRAFASVNGVVTHALLLEVDVAGRPSRLELTTHAGMLTLHPEEGSGGLHGNVVTAAGMRHLALPWSADHGLEIASRPIAAAVTAYRLARTTTVGEGRSVPVVVIDADLRVAGMTRRYTRIGVGEWRIEAVADDPGPVADDPGPVADDPGPVVLAIDERGVPVLPVDAREWPLELD